MATHSNILAWKILWTEDPGGATIHVVTKELDTTQQLSTHSHIFYFYTYYKLHSKFFLFILQCIVFPLAIIFKECVFFPKKKRRLCLPTYSPFLIVFIHLCRFRFPSGVILFLLQGLPVFLVSLLILMPVSFCMSEKVFISPLCSVQFSHSVVSNSLRPMNHSTPGLPVHHQLPEFTQTHVH